MINCEQGDGMGTPDGNTFRYHAKHKQKKTPVYIALSGALLPFLFVIIVHINVNGVWIDDGLRHGRHR